MVNFLTAYPGVSDTAGLRKLLQGLIGDKTILDTIQCVQEVFQHAMHASDNLWKIAQLACVGQVARVVHHYLNAEYAFAFAIDLQCQLAVVHFEDGYIIGRFLDGDSPSLGMWRLPFSLRPMLESEDGLEAIQRQRRPAAIDQRLKYLLHLETRAETQVPAVFDLIC